jgi:predicted alpha/beta superfamily hydrolase
MSNKLLFLFFVLIQVVLVQAQVTITITDLPRNTPDKDVLYLAGSFNNWNPGDSLFKFKKFGSNQKITLNKEIENAEYKVTRGSWNKVETDSLGGNIANRKFSSSFGLNQKIKVAGWSDFEGKSVETKSTALANVKLISANFYMPQLKRNRKIWIYLPSDYEDAIAKRYSVLYMHDGQNLFDTKTSFSGEWGIDETLAKLEKTGDLGCIVVGIENGGENRINEYSPFVNKEYGGGEGKAYIQFIVKTLKPYIDSAYRTHTDQMHTGIAGSSMGGLISLFGALAYPNIFGKVGAFSPALWFSDSLFEFAKNSYLDSRINVYYVAGSNESEHMVSDIIRMDSLLNKKGALFYNSSVNIKADGEHKEWFWKREFGPFYQTSFFDVSEAYQKQWQDRLERNTKLVPNPANEYTEINTWPINSIKVLTADGTTIFEAKVNSPIYKLDVSNYPNGFYYVVLDFGNSKITKSLEVRH